MRLRFSLKDDSHETGAQVFLSPILVQLPPAFAGRENRDKDSTRHSSHPPAAGMEGKKRGDRNEITYASSIQMC